MSTPIKPPGLEPTAPTDVSEAASEAAVEAPQGVAPTPEAGAVDALSGIAQALADQSVSADEAVAQLIERAVASVGEHLDPAARAELTAMLREAVDQDPGLLALRDDLK